MTTNEMRAVIINKYGVEIRGKRLSQMSDQQIYAIYNSIRKRESASGVLTPPARCATCGWFSDGICGRYDYSTNSTTLACANGYCDIRVVGPQHKEA